MKNLEIIVTKDEVTIHHYGEELCSYNKESICTDKFTIDDVMNMAQVVHQAHTNIMALRKALHKPLIVGKTIVETFGEGITLEYYILREITGNRKHRVGWTQNMVDALETLNDIRDDEDPNATLYKALIKVGGDRFEIIDEELVK
jgi:hypothetical protein